MLHSILYLVFFCDNRILLLDNPSIDKSGKLCSCRLLIQWQSFRFRGYNVGLHYVDVLKAKILVVEVSRATTLSVHNQLPFFINSNKQFSSPRIFKSKKNLYCLLKLYDEMVHSVGLKLENTSLSETIRICHQGSKSSRNTLFSSFDSPFST